MGVCFGVPALPHSRRPLLARRHCRKTRGGSLPFLFPSSDTLRREQVCVCSCVAESEEVAAWPQQRLGRHRCGWREATLARPTCRFVLGSWGFTC